MVDRPNLQRLVRQRDQGPYPESLDGTSNISLETTPQARKVGRKRRTWNQRQLKIIEVVKLTGVTDKALSELCLEEPHILGDRRKLTPAELRSMKDTIRKKLKRLGSDKKIVRDSAVDTAEVAPKGQDKEVK